MKPYYDHAGITIYHGDCREVLREVLRPVDVVLTDPPYGIGESYLSVTDNRELVQMAVAVVNELRLTVPRVVVTPGVKNLYIYEQPSHVGSFGYPAGCGLNPWGFTCWQPILFYGKDPYGGKGSRPDSYTSYEAAEKNGHPCPKPLGQWKWLLNRVTNAGDVVLDPFLGSGTTVLAAKDLGLTAIGIEIEEKYCEIAARRLSQEVLSFE